MTQAENSQKKLEKERNSDFDQHSCVLTKILSLAKL